MLGTNEATKTTSSEKSTSTQTSASELLVASRCHGNFAENVPFCLLAAAVVEMNGGDRRLLTGALGTLLLFRIVHVEFGLRRYANKSWGRAVGHFGTMGWLAWMSTYAAWLGRSYWKL
jgi:uncharacterized protein